MKEVVFPAMNPAAEAKLKRLLENIGEYMGAELTPETVVVLSVNLPDDRPDVEAIVKRLAGNKTGLVQTKA